MEKVKVTFPKCATPLQIAFYSSPLSHSYTRLQSFSVLLFFPLSVVPTLELALILAGDCHPSALNPAQVAALSQTLRDEKQIRAPSAACLSPAGQMSAVLHFFQSVSSVDKTSTVINTAFVDMSIISHTRNGKRSIV